jgi:hypothetical protein
VAETDETLPVKGEFAPAKKRRFPIKTLVALLVVVAVGLPVVSMLQGRYYERYPQLRGRIAAHTTSTHARISCAGCHVDPGPLGYGRFAVKAIPAFYSQLIFGPSEQNVLSVPDREACQKCHTAYRQVSPDGDLLIPHKAHVEVLKINCAECHKDLVHSANSKGFNRPEMEACLKVCHNGKTATNQCSKCHTRKQVPQSHMAKDWLQVHPTMTETGKCGECHAWAPDYCRQCHLNRPKSHAGNWKQLHGARAKSRGTKGCVFCHGEAFCKKCH